MTTDERSLLLAELMRGIPRSAPIYRQLEEYEAADLDRIDPVIERIIYARLMNFAQFVFGTVLTPEQMVNVHQRMMQRTQ